ncbi:phage tail length tape measure family protein [Treponema pectinovorum]|uniref:phage tail length tape measure family protein n=1 Tax=Treponema pectinovorum TaxID=164 RepID=UPI0011CB7BFF|nr:phage tail length tape measure family protein [Treponema pectinovorum]
MAELTEEMRVLVTAEVDRAVKNLQALDKKTNETGSNFKKLGVAIGSAFAVKEIVNFSKNAISSFEQSQKTARTLSAVLKATGSEAWTSSEKLQSMARSLQELTGYEDDAILSMQSVLLGFKNIKGDTFEEATKAILDMANVMGMDLKSAAQSVGKALDDPEKGLDSLKKQGFNFSESQKGLMKSLMDTGKKAQAQKIILDELAGTFGGAAQAGVTASNKLKNALGDLQKTAGQMLSPLAEDLANLTGDFLASLGNMDAGTKDFIAGMLEVVAVSAPCILAIKGISIALTALAANPVMLAIGATVAGVALIGGAAKKSRNEFDNLSKEINNTVSAEKQLLQAFSQGNEQKVLDQKTTDELIKLYPQLNGTINAYTTTVEEASAATKKLNDQKLLDSSSSGIKNYMKRLDDISSLEEKINKYSKSSNDIDLEHVKILREQKEEQLKIAESLRTQINERIKVTGKELLSNGSLKDLPVIKLPAKLELDTSEESLNLNIKTWKEWWEKITGISQFSFKTGQEAGKLYVKGLESALSASEDISKVLSEDISKVLGEKSNLTGFIENQMGEIQKNLQALLTVPQDKIDKPFELIDKSISELIKKYKDLKSARNRALIDDEIFDLQKKVDNLGKTERELVLKRLDDIQATAEQKEAYMSLYDAIALSNGSFSSLAEKLGIITKNGLLQIDGWKEYAKVLGETVSQLANASFDATLSGFETFGKALGEGASASDALKSAFVDMAQSILNQLPLLFMQAGLQLIAQGQWAMGLGFIAAAGSTAITAGFVKGKKNSSKETNALGGVYGDDSYARFAKGGTFTNSIVTSPTVFRFARGSDFGTGLMGEAGPEAIMPLKRGSDGTLGVESSVANVAIPVYIYNYSSEEVSAKESFSEDGQKQIEVKIGAVINAHIASGKADKAMQGRYGVKAQGV